MNMSKDITKHTFIKRVKDTVKQYAMLNKGDRVLVAVSGGPDSVCLLRVLLDMRRALGIEIVVGNMDHALRGKESASDSRFVKELSRKLEVEFVHKKVNVRRTGKKGTSVEERAREKRYEFLTETAVRKNCNVIATGHTMDDQAETILMRLIYGSSTTGITGIPPVRYQGLYRIIRPLIRVEKRDVLSFLKKVGLEYVEDSSNLDKKFVRNNIRYEVLPFLEKYNPRLKRTLVNLSDAVREDSLFVSREKEKYINSHINTKGAADSIKIKDIMLQPKTLRKELFKELFKKAGGNVKKLTYRHWMDMDYFLRTAVKNKSLNFPGKVKVIKTKDEIVFAKWS